MNSHVKHFLEYLIGITSVDRLTQLNHDHHFHNCLGRRESDQMKWLGYAYARAGFGFSAMYFTFLVKK
jgi:hypothetical protein